MDKIEQLFKTEQLDIEDFAGEKVEYLWQDLGDEARLLRMYGNTLRARVPARIEGRLVTEIGAYCFSASEHLPKEGFIITQGTIVEKYEKDTCWTFLEEGRIDAVSMPSVAGRLLEEVELPDEVSTIHNAAFYNCRALKFLSLGRLIRGIGSDVFMNCIHLDQMLLRCGPEEEHGLSLILERLTSQVEVEFGPGEGKILFPEYYEWLNEVTPAHIFSRTIQGEGLRMRRAFQDKKIDYGKYDQCFSNVLVGENEDTICRIACLRLRWPIRLTAEMEAAYGQAVRERLDLAVGKSIRERDLAMLHFLWEYFQPSQGELAGWMEEAIAADWSEGSSYLMEKKRKRMGAFAEKSFEFDEFDDF